MTFEADAKGERQQASGQAYNPKRKLSQKRRGNGNWGEARVVVGTEDERVDDGTVNAEHEMLPLQIEEAGERRLQLEERMQWSEKGRENQIWNKL